MIGSFNQYYQIYSKEYGEDRVNEILEVVYDAILSEVGINWFGTHDVDPVISQAVFDADSEMKSNVWKLFADNNGNFRYEIMFEYLEEKGWLEQRKAKDLMDTKTFKLLPRKGKEVDYWQEVF